MESGIYIEGLTFGQEREYGYPDVVVLHRQELHNKVLISRGRSRLICTHANEHRHSRDTSQKPSFYDFKLVLTCQQERERHTNCPNHQLIHRLGKQARTMFPEVIAEGNSDEHIHSSADRQNEDQEPAIGHFECDNISAPEGLNRHRYCGRASQCGKEPADCGYVEAAGELQHSVCEPGLYQWTYTRL